MVLLEKTAAFPVFDCFADKNQTPELRKWGYGGASDPDPQFLNFVSHVTEGVHHIHFVAHSIPLPLPENSPMRQFYATHPNLLSCIWGHTHYTWRNEVCTVGDRTLYNYQCGNFSWNAEQWGICGQKTEAGEDGGSFGVCYFDARISEDAGKKKTTVLRYMVYPEMDYGTAVGRGGVTYPQHHTFPRFYQPRMSTEGTEHSGNNLIFEETEA